MIYNLTEIERMNIAAGLTLNESCPVKDKIYGGLPSGGGYGSATEYEIGAQRIAEAAHCILGSIGKVLHNPHDDPWLTEKSHIHEELAIIKYSIKEYSKDLYSDRMYRDKKEVLNDYVKPEYAEEFLEYVQKSIKSIKLASPALKTKANALSRRVGKDYSDRTIELISASYDIVSILAEVMKVSVADWPKGKVKNGFKSNKLIKATNRLENAIKEQYSK